MSRRILHSRSYRPLLNEAGRQLRAWAKDGEVVVLSATRAAGDEFVRAQSGSGLLGVHRFTLAQFAMAVAASAVSERGLCMVSRLGSEALAARAVFQLHRDGLLPYFAPVARTPGFARVLAGTLLELRMQAMPLDALAKTSAPGADLARLASFCQNELAARQLADQPEIFDLASQASHRLLGLPVICLDVTVGGACEERFLASVIGRAPRALALQLTGDDAGLETMARIFGVAPESVTESAGANALARARRWLFSLDAPAAATVDESVDLFSAAGEGMECVEMARRILALSSAGTAFDQMAIVLRDVERYQSLVQEALRRAGIPFYQSRGTMRPDPSGRAFLALLACASEGCSASRFAEYLSLGETSSDTGAPSGWERLLVDAAVIGGPHRWRRRLQGLEQEVRARLSSPDLDDTGRERIERQIANLHQLADFALPLIDRLSALPKRAAWGAWIERLTELAEYALRRPASVLAVLEELEAMDAVGPVELEEVYAVLEDRLRFLRVEPEGRRYGAVFVCSIDEVRGMHFPVVFLPGLAESIFPRRALENPLLLDRYRVELNAGLALRDDLVAQERLRLVSTMAAASERLIVSYPSMDTSLSRPRVPSFYALEIVRAVEGKLPDLAGFRKRTAAAAHTRLSWPAPDDPSVAIDDAEYDLASLRPLIESRNREKSAARYLMEVNVHLARSLRARAQRWRAGWFESDGLVKLDEPAQQALREYSLTRKPYSPSALQNYAQCPYRFALRSVFHLSPREEPEALEQMDPLTRGSLFHRAQFDLFRALQQREWLPLPAAQLAEIFTLADDILNRVAAEYEERFAPAIERVWKTEIEDVRTDFRAWIRDVAQTEADWSPIHFEFGFGLPLDRNEPHDPASTPNAAKILNGYLVRGSMDLVERHQRTGALRIVDHKTGKAPEKIPASVGGGSLLQPLLYAHAGEALWGAPVQSGRLSYCTQRGGYRKIDIVVSPQSSDRLRQVLQTIEGAIHEGFLPAAPAQDACKQCDYRAVCGPYEGDRVRRKKQDALENLEAIRSLP